MRTLLTSITTSLLFLAACHPVSKDAESETLATRAEPLPIIGTWKATDVWGSFEESAGERKAVRASAKDLQNGLWRVKLEIDSQGIGLMQGLVQCTGPTNVTSTPNRIQQASVMNAIFGLLSLPNLVKRTIDGVDCAKSPNGAISSMLSVVPSGNMFGQRHTSLPKNLGVFGEGKSISAADNECRKMRGVRFVSVKDSSACVGFTDAKANNIRFLILPPGEIYAMRVNLTRD
jgi:hypothetical protein